MLCVVVCWCVCVRCVCAVCVCCVSCVCVLCVSSPDPPPRTAPPPDRPSAGPPKMSRFFSFSRHNFHSFSLSLGVFSCLFSSLSGSSRGIVVENTTKIPQEDSERERGKKTREDTQRERERKRMKIVAGEGKKTRNFGLPTLRRL